MASSVNLDDPTPEETEIHQEMAHALLLDKVCDDYAEAKTQRTYSKFLKAAKSSGVNVERIHEGISVKARHLREIMGYKGLTGQNNISVPLRNAKHARIGNVYLRVYNEARKSLEATNN
tara:strand:+ start:224 stop:580 length:357 start_codon:yes stop_codon:yes gene_type:complete